MFKLKEGTVVWSVRDSVLGTNYVYYYRIVWTGGGLRAERWEQHDGAWMAVQSSLTPVQFATTTKLRNPALITELQCS